MNQTIRIGIVGANVERGWAKDAHIPAIRQIPGLQLTAVSARDQTSAEKAANTFGAIHAFADSLALTRSDAVDLVSVTVKVPEHMAIVQSALQAGKHVYCEWPLGVDLEQATTMANTARDAGVHVMIGLQGNASPAVLRAVELMQNGSIGQPLAMRVFSPTAGWGASAPAFYSYLNDKSTGATLVTITGGHTLALMQLLVGKFRELDARASILRSRVNITGTSDSIKRTCADHLLVIAEHASGCISTLEVVGGQSVESPFALTIEGSQGTLSLTSNHPGGFQVGNMTLSVNGKPDLNYDRQMQGLQGPPANVAENYLRLLRDINEQTFTVPDFDDAVELTRLLEVIETASTTGTRQRV